jgi:phosphoribosylaminoimidazole carboxylase
MLAQAAALLNIPISILDVGEDGPAKQVISHTAGSSLTHVDGSFSDPAKIRELADKVDILTVEIEHVDVTALDQLKHGISVYPSPSTIRIIQDKYLQKQHLSSHGSPVGPFVSVESDQKSISSAVDMFGLPMMLKARTSAYDGRGNFLLRSRSPEAISEAISALGNGSRQLYAESFVPFTKELAVMVVRSTNGEIRSYPVVETIHKENICHLVFAPARFPDAVISKRAQKVAEGAVQVLDGCGVFGVEMFLLANGELFLTS